MKLWHSYVKELLLSSRSFYFYIEIFMAVFFLVILLFVIPENFVNKDSEYIYLNLPPAAQEIFIADISEDDLDGQAELVEIKGGEDVIQALLYESNEKKFYLLNDEEAIDKLAEKERKLGAVIELDEQGELHYKYYLQGYESQRLKNILLVVHNEDLSVLEAQFDQQEVRPLSIEYDVLSDRENVLPSFLTFNGSLMGLFIIAAYIFLDKQEGVIKAYAVTPSAVWQYLLSKVGVLLTTTIITSLVIVVPVMGLAPNYPILILFLLTTGFFASALGLFLASFYKDMMQAFGAIYLIMMALLIPNIAYFIPSWDPTWIKLIPSYPMLQGFKEIILKNGDISYVLTISLGFFVAGLILFLLSNYRYKKTITI